MTRGKDKTARFHLFLFVGLCLSVASLFLLFFYPLFLPTFENLEFAI